MAYSTTYQGIAVTSNVPLTQAQPSGTHYDTVVTFTSKIGAYIASGGINVVSYIDPNLVAGQFAQRGHPISNLQITRPAPNQVKFSYNSTSPIVLEVVDIIIAIFLILFPFGGPLGWIADAVGIALLAAGGIGLIISAVGVTVTQLAQAIGPVGTTALIVAGLAALGLVGYMVVKSPTARGRIASAGGYAAAKAREYAPTARAYASKGISTVRGVLNG